MKSQNTPSTNTWQQIAEYVRWTPSPHNTQPYRLKVIDEQKAEIVFMPNRGLYVADPQGKFTWLSAGIFAELCSIAAHDLGFELQATFTYEPLYKNNDYQTSQTVATLQLTKSQVKIKDLPAELIFKRHTSRLPYNGRAVEQPVLDKLTDEAAKFGHSVGFSTEAPTIKWVVDLNKDSLFYDLEDTGVRTELKHWLRFSKKEAYAKQDGLSAECLHLPGWLLQSFFRHTWFWLAPGIRNLVAVVYKNTMKGIGTIGWLQGSYQTTEDWVRAGRLMIRLWLIITEAGVYWHPYGSIITNDKARQTMLNRLHIADENEGKNMVWLLLRLGYSSEPPRSERLPLEEIII